jgi:hypothetical protein
MHIHVYIANLQLLIGNCKHTRVALLHDLAKLTRQFLDLLIPLLWNMIKENLSARGGETLMQAHKNTQT